MKLKWFGWLVLFIALVGLLIWFKRIDAISGLLARVKLRERQAAQRITDTKIKAAHLRNIENKNLDDARKHKAEADQWAEKAADIEIEIINLKTELGISMDDDARADAFNERHGLGD